MWEEERGEYKMMKGLWQYILLLGISFIFIWVMVIMYFYLIILTDKASVMIVMTLSYFGIRSIFVIGEMFGDLWRNRR